MKSNRQTKGNISEAPKKQVGSPACTGVRKSTNRRRGPHQKVTGVLPFPATQESSKQLSRSKSIKDTKKEILELAAKTGQVHPSTKIKLQLFPIDEGTRIGLEKDGYNPFLELTLSARKKVSSVLAHINTKWGCSSVALGEPMLFPYNVRLEVPGAGRRWTLKDTSISAGDVYTTVESPPIFRLRYGWFSTPEPQQAPSTSTTFICIDSESTQKGCNAISDLTGTQVEGKGDKNLIAISETADAVVINQLPLAAAVGQVDDEVKMDNDLVESIAPWSDSFTDLSIGGLLSEASLQGIVDNRDLKTNWNRSSLQPISLISDLSVGGLLSEASLQGKVNNNELLSTGNKLGLEQSPFRWDDSLTALSIGGLLSEASLQGKIDNADRRSNESKSVVQPSTLISDSFDAVIAAQMNFHSQAGKPPSHDSHSSILDAEETCHAFSFQKFSSSGKSVRLSGRPSHDSSSNSFRFPNFSQLNKQTGFAEDPHCQELKTEHLARSQVHSEDSSSSLGLRGIKWVLY